MKSSKNKDRKGLAFKIGQRYLDKNLQDIDSGEFTGHVLTSDERKELKKLHQRTYLISGFIGAFFVLAVVLPYHLFPWFQQPQEISLWGFSFSFELNYSIFALIMIFPEIWLLNLVNVRAVKNICRIYQYPSPKHPDYEQQIKLLTEAGLEMPDKHMKSLGINPYIGLNKLSYYAIFFLAKLKAALSNVVFKMLIRRFLGRYALRIVMDLMGIPVYAFWDAWASHQVMKEAQVRLISTSVSKQFLSKITDKELQAAQEKIPSLIHFIAQEKRSYNYALYAFVRELLKRLPNLELDNDRKITVKDVLTNRPEADLVLGKLMAFGFIVDGTLSVKERLLVRELSKENWFPATSDELDDFLKSYIKGDGLADF